MIASSPSRPAPEDVSTITSADPVLLARVAYHLGNRHVRTQVGPGFIRYRHDRAIDKIVRTLGAEVVFGESSLGAIVTHGDPTGATDNTLVGADFNYRKSEFFPRRALEGNLWVQHSFSRNATGRGDMTGPAHGNGQHAYGVRLAYPNDIWNWSIEAREIGKDFNPALGFVRRRGIRRGVGSLRHRDRGDGWLRTFDKKLDVEVVTNRRDRVETANVVITPLELTSDVSDVARLLYRHDFEKPLEDFSLGQGLVIPANEYHFDAVELGFTASPHRPVSGEVEVRAGTFYDGYQTRVDTSLSWRPSRHLVFAPEYQVRYLAGLSGHSGTIHLARLRVNVQFTADVSWVTLAQWDNGSHEMGINTRFRWIIEDGRELFLVLNQGVRTLAGDDGPGRTEPLVKLEWAFRF